MIFTFEKKKNILENYIISFFILQNPVKIQSKLFFHQTFSEIVYSKSSRCDGKNQGF